MLPRSNPHATRVSFIQSLERTAKDRRRELRHSGTVYSAGCTHLPTRVLDGPSGRWRHWVTADRRLFQRPDVIGAPPLRRRLMSPVVVINHFVHLTNADHAHIQAGGIAE
jgi:hypothetical protein